MNDVAGQVLDYLDYKNKLKTAEWAERLWQQHLNGTPQDIRDAAERQRYVELLDRVEQSRAEARKLHLRRARHQPRFTALSAAG
jgi:hypothetical protein